MMRLSFGKLKLTDSCKLNVAGRHCGRVVQVVARTREDILKAGGVKPTLSPNLNTLATVEALGVKRLLFIGVGCQVIDDFTLQPLPREDGESSNLNAGSQRSLARATGPDPGCLLHCVSLCNFMFEQLSAAGTSSRYRMLLRPEFFPNNFKCKLHVLVAGGAGVKPETPGVRTPSRLT